MKIGDLFEGVVSRRGNKLQVGSLELQLYPDHIFYVVGGGKDADLSIYKDGAFKPPRNNEIYLKDAASRGVPQAFINLFSKFFATQDIDVVVNGLEALFKSHVKENRQFQPKTSPIVELVHAYGFFTSLGNIAVDDFAETPEGKQELKILTQRFNKEAKTFANLNPQQIEKNRDNILRHIHSMIQYSVPVLQKYLRKDKFAEKQKQINDLINKYKAAVSTKEDIDEALLSPRVHEIFLKGLVGAILSGGFSLGLDYAKEKTADLDKAGLQAVYKSIDPREYPQLTKKLTPQDRKGLDAILGKLKEHAMRIDDLVSEEEKRMSRVGKGVMKYGKDGMKALAKAGRDGASDEKLDKLRDKYDKYDEDINEGPRGMGVAARDWAQNKKSQASRRGDAGWSKDYRKPGEPSKAELSAMAAKAKADYDKKKGIKESDDHEASMAKGQLYNACKNAMALMKMIQDGDNLEGWVASKITKAADYLNAVHDYMAYEQVSEDKQKGVDGKACWKGYKRMGTKQKGGKTVDNCVKIKK